MAPASLHPPLRRRDAVLRGNVEAVLRGNVEADGHGLRRSFVSAKTLHLRQEIAAAIRRRKRGSCPVWICDVRVAAVASRGKSMLALTFLPFEHVPRGARPLPEDYAEIILATSCSLLPTTYSLLHTRPWYFALLTTSYYLLPIAYYLLATSH